MSFRKQYPSVQKVRLPITFEGLNIKNPKPDELMEVARIACAEGDTMENMLFAVEPADVVDAILGADAIGSAFQEQASYSRAT